MCALSWIEVEIAIGEVEKISNLLVVIIYIYLISHVHTRNCNIFVVSLCTYKNLLSILIQRYPRKNWTLDVSCMKNHQIRSYARSYLQTKWRVIEVTSSKVFETSSKIWHHGQKTCSRDLQWEATEDRCVWFRRRQKSALAAGGSTSQLPRCNPAVI